MERRAQMLLVDDTDGADALTEIALLQGFVLSAKQSQDEKLTRNKVICITDSFNAHKPYVCLDRELWEEIIEQIQQLDKQYMFYCFDNILSDAAKRQLAESCRVVTM